jgi:hypothetical protein
MLSSQFSGCRYQARSDTYNSGSIFPGRPDHHLLAGPLQRLTPTVFGVTLLATKHLPNWWDLLVLAAFSLGIYYWAVHSTMSREHV